jgi:hypothetical protein
MECWNGVLEGMMSNLWNYSLEVLPCQGYLNRRYDAQKAIGSTSIRSSNLVPGKLLLKDLQKIPHFNGVTWVRLSVYSVVKHVHS